MNNKISMQNDGRSRSGGVRANGSSVELQYRSLENLTAAKMARGLGIFSLALGLTETFFPGKLARLAGLSDDHRRYLPLLGAREIAHGASILKGQKPTAAVWTRVGGDAIDLAFLAAAFSNTESNKTRLAVATAAVAGVTVFDVLCATKLSRPWTESDGNTKAPTTVGQSSARSQAVTHSIEV